MWVEIDVLWGNCSVICKMYERGKEVVREWLCQPGLSRAPRLVFQTRHYRYPSLFFFECFDATQLERQVDQERTQVVWSNKVVRERVAQRHSRNGHWTHGHWTLQNNINVVLEWMYLYVGSLLWLWNVVSPLSFFDFFVVCRHTASAPITSGTVTGVQ